MPQGQNKTKNVKQKQYCNKFNKDLKKNTSTNGTILTEHLLNISRGPQTSKTTRKIPI